MFPAVSITFTRYREPDWLVLETIESLAAQINIMGEIIFLDQNWTKEFAAVVEQHSVPNLKFRCLPCEEKGLSYARNYGIKLAEHDHVLFIDSDAIAEPNWAFEMADGLERGAAIVGSRILPKWHGRPPILARSSVVRDVYSLLDWGTENIEVTRVVGAGFGIDISKFSVEMKFSLDFGRRDGKLLSGEESDLCARVCKAGGEIAYRGKALVHHQILPERLHLGWITRRLFYAGMARAQAGGAPNPSGSPGFWDWALLPIILPPYAVGYLKQKLAN